jgi:hypothetical protein
MSQIQPNALEAKIREALKEHQHEGLHLIGGVDQLVHRLVDAVEEWLQEQRTAGKKSA